MSRIFGKKRALLGIVASLAIAAAAIAYWTTTGDGTGSGSAKAANGTLSLSGTIDDQLAPGESSSVTIKVSNPSDTDLYVNDTILSNIVAAGDCVDTDFSETNGGTVAQDVIVPAGAVNQVLADHNITFANSADNQDDCKGAAISFDLDSN